MNFYNSYQPQYGTYQPPQQIVKVSGENGARAYQMGANSSVLMLDETAPIVWLKTTDGAGYPSLMPYDIVPHEQPQPIDMSNLERRLSRLEEIVNESHFRQHEQPKEQPKSKSKQTKSTEHDLADFAE